MELEIVSLAQVEEAFRVGERDVMVELLGVGDAMVDELMSRLRAGKISVRNLNSQRRSRWKGTKAAESVLRGVLESIGQVGIEHVVDELGRQDG